MNILNKNELTDLSKIKNTYYMIPILKKLDEYIDKYGLAKSLDYLNTILNSAKDDVEILLDKRVLDGEIKDKSQARKSIAGNAFSLLIKYLFLTLKENQLIKSNIFVTSNPEGATMKLNRRCYKGLNMVIWIKMRCFRFLY